MTNDNMANVFLTCTARDDRARYSRRDYERLLRFAKLDDLHRHELVSSPDEADIVIFAGSSEPAFRDVTRSMTFRKHSNRSVVFASGDRAIPLIPGIYAGLETRWARFVCGAATPGFYIRVAENDSLEMAPASHNARYLYSFVGSIKNHPVRTSVLRLADGRAYLRDSSSDAVKQADGIHGRNKERGVLFRDIMEESKFILCPRGLGVSTWRLFEAMRAGRAPVIISDQWLPPLGPDWPAFSVRVRERDVNKIPELLRHIEAQAQKMGQKAREEWLRYYDENVIFSTVVDLAMVALRNFRERNRAIYALRRLQFFEPFFLRHWVISPTARRILGRD